MNGVTVNNGRVQDLFRSVQLNVNNPHFLIMQGRITKVLNMKPPEVMKTREISNARRLTFVVSCFLDLGYDGGGGWNSYVRK